MESGRRTRLAKQPAPGSYNHGARGRSIFDFLIVLPGRSAILRLGRHDDMGCPGRAMRDP